MKRDFTALIEASSDLSSLFTEGLVFIGGLAVYIHAINCQETKPLAELPDYVDLYISQANMIDLRDIEHMTTNRRLTKQQLVKNGFEFDVYIQRDSDLAVPYEEVMARSQSYDMLRVASLEHLLALKLVAHGDRKRSPKGDKDARDILRIATIASSRPEPLDPQLILPYWGTQELNDLVAIGKGSAPVALAKGNVHEARAFRRNIESAVQLLKNLELTTSQPSARRPK